MSAFSVAALDIDRCRIALRYHEHLRLHGGSPPYDPDEHARALDAYRAALLGLRGGIDEQLAALPPPEPMAEKVAGYVSDSLHG